MTLGIQEVFPIWCVILVYGCSRVLQYNQGRSHPVLFLIYLLLSLSFIIFSIGQSFPNGFASVRSLKNKLVLKRETYDIYQRARNYSKLKGYHEVQDHFFLFRVIVLDCSIIFEEKCRRFATHFWLRLLTTWESWSLPGDSPILDTCNLYAWNFSTTCDIWITKSFMIWHWFDRLSYLWTWLHLFEENDSSMKTLSHGHVDTSWWGQEPTRSKRHGEVSEPSRSLWGLSKKTYKVAREMPMILVMTPWKVDF